MAEVIQHSRDGRPEMWLRMLFQLKQHGTEVARKSRLMSNENGTEGREEERSAKDVVALNESISAMAEPYSRAWNLGFAKNILRYLPRELSDMIYHELASLYNADLKDDEDDVIHYRKAKEIVKQVGSWRGTQRFVTVYPRVTVEDYPHYLDRAFMGLEFASGLSEVFHAEKKFEVPGLPDLNDLLSKDRFETNCIPSVHIKYLDIDISLSPLIKTTGEYRGWRSSKYDHPIKFHFEKVARALEILRSLRYRHGAKLSLVIDCDRFDNAERKFAEVLYPLVYDLKHLGWTVEIYARSNRWCGRWFARRPATFDYSIPRDAWDEIARNDSAFASDEALTASKRRD